MKENQKTTLELKRKHVQLKLQARQFIYRGVEFYWLDYFNTIKKLGLQFEIEYLCTVTQEEESYYKEAVEKINNPDLNPTFVKVISESLHDKMFSTFPSISAFKYVMNLPMLHCCESDSKKMLLAAQEILQIKDEEIYFLSTDCSPLLKLRWSELIMYSNEIFNDGLMSFVFTDINNTWIIFKSIENEWRCGFWKK